MNISIKNIKNLTFRSIILDRNTIIRILLFTFLHFIFTIFINLNSEFCYKISSYYNNFLVFYTIYLISINSRILRTLNDEKYDFMYSILPVSQTEKLISYYISGFIFTLTTIFMLFLLNFQILKLLEYSNILTLRYDKSLFKIFKSMFIFGIIINSLMVFSALFFHNNSFLKSIMKIITYFVLVGIFISTFLYLLVNPFSRYISERNEEGTYLYKFEFISDFSSFLPLFLGLFLIFIWIMNYFLMKEKNVY